MFIDSHCHLNMLVKDETSLVSMQDIVNKAKENNLEKILCIAVNTTDWDEMYNMCEPFSDFIYLSAGIHPCYMDDDNFALLSEQARHKSVVAIGETGLDYYYGNTTEIKAKQKDSFAKHIELSSELKKPLVVHTRDAGDDTISILKAEILNTGGANPDGQGVIHCYTETLEMAKKALDLGFYISFSGIITFKNANQIREVAEYVPMDRILIETDSPYLAPMPFRGKTNNPHYVQYIAKTIADIKDLTTEEVGQITTNNFYSLFV